MVVLARSVRLTLKSHPSCISYRHCEDMSIDTYRLVHGHAYRCVCMSMWHGDTCLLAARVHVASLVDVGAAHLYSLSKICAKPRHDKHTADLAPAIVIGLDSHGIYRYGHLI